MYLRQAAVFGLTIWASCSSGKQDPILGGIGSTIMGIALMVGMLVTPYAESAFAYGKEHVAVTLSCVALLVALVKSLGSFGEECAQAPSDKKYAELATVRSCELRGPALPRLYKWVTAQGDAGRQRAEWARGGAVPNGSGELNGDGY
eukprot:Skav231904  [mRNA]  locus=scaffold960:228213:232111:- [translate_table: standard]